MKKLYTLLAFALFGLIGNAQIVNIPDANFKARLLAAQPGINTAAVNTYYDSYSRDWIPYGPTTAIDTNGNGEIEVSEAQRIRFLNITSAGISNLTGLEAFTNLNVLNFSFNEIISIDLSPFPNLGGLNCSSNQLSSLNLSGLTYLKTLRCGVNQLQNLNITGFNNLTYIECGSNQLTTLNVLGLASLEKLLCGGNPSMTSLNVSGMASLQELYCDHGQFQNLNLSGATNLKTIQCQFNRLANINLSGLNSLEFLTCNNNELTSLSISGLANFKTLRCENNLISDINLSGATALQEVYCNNNHLSNINLQCLTNLSGLFCHYNQLASIDVSGLPNLSRLNCSNNQLPTLDLSGLSRMYSLNCDNNLLTELNLKNGNYCWCYPNVPWSVNGDYLSFSGNPNLQYICADGEDLAVIQQKISLYGYTNCHVSPYCSLTPGGTFYTVMGDTHYDGNNNGCDTADLLFPNLKFSVSKGTENTTIIPNTSGTYQFDLQAGTYTITPTLENPTYFNVSPATATVSFPSAVSPFTQNFCISANGIHNDLEIVILPLNRARPGFDIEYKIIYKNKGNTTQNGTVSLWYYDPIEDFVSSTPNITSQGTNTLNWAFSNLLPFETREITMAFNLNSPVENPPVNEGGIITHSTTITGATDETPTNNTSSTDQTVVNSLDPNEKICIEGDQLPVGLVGNYLHYIIHFENTGTANAENIVVKDVIDTSKFDIASLVPLHGSHLFETKISNSNQVEFIFENINLPFDDAHNDGYVAFKIKTLPTVTAGQTINNSASIYFDYNAPIVTNTYTVNVYNPLAATDFEFNALFSLSPVPARNTINIKSKQDAVMTSASIYNTLGQLVQVNANPSEAIDVSGLRTGSYFIKIISDKGTAGSKFIKE